SCKILRDGIRMRWFADATLMRYGAWTYSGTVDALSASASSRGLGAFQLCGLPRKIWTTSAPSACAAASGSCGLTCEPISTTPSLVSRADGRGLRWTARGEREIVWENTDARRSRRWIRLASTGQLDESELILNLDGSV